MQLRIFILLSCFIPVLALAQEKVRTFNVQVRTVQGSSLEPESIKYEFDKDLEDLRGQLSNLKYKRYKLISKQNQKIELDQVGSMDLVSGQKLRFKPTASDSKKTCLWLQWKDANDNEVLDTKIHVPNGHSMLAGTDMDENSDDGLILAISAERIN